MLQHRLHGFWHLYLSANEHPAAALADLGARDLWQHVFCSLWRLPGDFVGHHWTVVFVLCAHEQAISFRGIL